MEASGGTSRPDAALVAEERQRLIDLALSEPGVKQSFREGYGGIGRDGIAELVDTTLSRDRVVEAQFHELGELRVKQRRAERWRRQILRPRLLRFLAHYNWIVILAVAGIVFSVGFYLFAGEIPTAEAAAGAGVFALFSGLLCALLWRLLKLTAIRAARIGTQASDRERHLLERTVLPEVRVHIADRPFDRTLQPIDTRGLGNLFDPKYEVPVAATAKLRERLNELEAGSVGIAGSRGVGKTTLIGIACSGTFEIAQGERRLAARGVMVSAPVRYEAREFIRFLFEELCLSVLPRTPEGWRRKVRARRRRRASLLLVLLMMLAPAAVQWVSFASGSGFGVGSQIQLAWTVTVSLLVVLLSLPIVAIAAVLRRSEDSGVEKMAEENLRHLRYLETVSQDMSGEIAAGGAKLGRKRGVSMAEQAWTLPDLIRQYKAFLELLAEERPVVIGIDELDKMRDAEEARGFLNDMKSLFDQPDVYYLVSVSEDALSDFERRGQPLRDVFDSIFADVIHVDCLSHQESSLLIKRRSIGVAPPWPALFHALSGGLPRESLRVARQAVRLAAALRKPDLKSEPRLDLVTAQLVVERALSVEHAASVIASRHVAADGSQPFLDWLRGLPRIDSKHLSVAEIQQALLERLRVGGLLKQLRAHAERDGLAGGGGLERVAIELAASSYHSLTCLEFFATLDSARFDAARDETPCVESEIDLLARGQRDLSMSPVISWLTVTEFRTRTALKPHIYPIA